MVLGGDWINKRHLFCCMWAYFKMVGSAVEFVLFLMLVQFVVLVFNSRSAFSLLIVSELCWWSMYCCYALSSAVFSNVTLVSMPLFILVLSAVDCSIWIMFVVYYNTYQVELMSQDIRSDVRFLFRSSRMMSSSVLNR